ncbi:hypothetical protein PJIAN_4218 [Paludibacter jiangxiensis]|uniref:Uncharacterized protein n=1 Tax=Paludibacter jiangxiensis TaxID=681398 RepID=A0A161LG00_9BACT|nr:hypothetical protein PJIAN_4218 [Paludibacter jiangxiensis]
MLINRQFLQITCKNVRVNPDKNIIFRSPSGKFRYSGIWV